MIYRADGIRNDQSPTAAMFHQSLLTLTLAFFLLFTGNMNALIAQGCSDAGFCTIGNLHQLPWLSTKTYKQKLTVFSPLGVGDEQVFIFAPGIQYDNRLNDRWAIQAKLTANYANGPLGKVTGPGDVFISGLYTIKNGLPWSTSILLGTKLPLNAGNLKINGLGLPMQYQSSLGTADLILGLSTNNAHWQFAAGWQQPLSGANKNEFLPRQTNGDELKSYPPSRSFDRKTDVLIRAAYTYKASRLIQLNGGLLAINHLGNDTYIDIDGNRRAITGSSGLTLNVTLSATFSLNERTTIGFDAGSPLVFRDVRPDGLTRKFVFAPQLIRTF